MAKLTKPLVAVTIALATGSPLIAGCTAHNGQSSPSKTPTASASPSPRSSVIDLTKTPPDISDSAKAFIRLANRTGSEEVAVIGNIKAGTVAVATECTGEGKTTIVIGKLATYTIPCAATPSTTYNEIGLGSSRQQVKVTVTASPGVHWGLSVGWRSGFQRPS
ncbi:hypothetical protein SAMN05216489_06009 [Streptomyces sp. 3213]|uniref:hypothetical protein n=1 Tax=Streptomyces sp. 3213.3 TaxID=1855348 RepID=UPI0008991A3B|nr:hypothetical protein [Streptomyces sp. 3213.3]SEE26023.1 hypothetical protein SAMN05216489_06009 [Streptomyces sp. 3213] [Streptomyces sp. 3213.3]